MKTFYRILLHCYHLLKEKISIRLRHYIFLNLTSYSISSTISVYEYWLHPFLNSSKWHTFLPFIYLKPLLTIFVSLYLNGIVCWLLIVMYIFIYLLICRLKMKIYHCIHCISLLYCNHLFKKKTCIYITSLFFFLRITLQ